MSLSYEAERELINRVRETHNPQTSVYVPFSQEDARSVASGFTILMRHEIKKGRLTDRASVTMTPFEQMYRSVHIAAAREAGHSVSLTQSGVVLIGLMVDRYYEEHGIEKNTPIPQEITEVMTGYINFKGIFDRVTHKAPQPKRRSIMNLLLRKK